MKIDATENEGNFMLLKISKTTTKNILMDFNFSNVQLGEVKVW